MLDTQTCLIWQRVVDTDLHDWQGASDYCGQLVLAGQSDWRLPTWAELASIADLWKEDPAINGTAFPNTPYDLPYWSSTTMEYGSKAKTISFADAGDDSRPVYGGPSLRARCVR